MYQVNSGVLIKKGITPHTPINFVQPSCTTQGTSPCDPKQETFKGKKYFVLGQRRQSTDKRPEFSLDMPYDFIGAPTEPKFCGNTIVINTTPFRKFIECLDKKNKKKTKSSIGPFHRNIDIDTQKVPEYNDVDFASWTRSKRAFIGQLTKNRSKTAELDSACDPTGDRIVVDELDHLDPNSGKITINTGMLFEIPFNYIPLILAQFLALRRHLVVKALFFDFCFIDFQGFFLYRNRENIFQKLLQSFC